MIWLLIASFLTGVGAGAMITVLLTHKLPAAPPSV